MDFRFYSYSGKLLKKGDLSWLKYFTWKCFVTIDNITQPEYYVQCCVSAVILRRNLYEISYETNTPLCNIDPLISLLNIVFILQSKLSFKLIFF